MLGFLHKSCENLEFIPFSIGFFPQSPSSAAATAAERDLTAKPGIYDAAAAAAEEKRERDTAKAAPRRNKPRDASQGVAFDGGGREEDGPNSSREFVLVRIMRRKRLMGLLSALHGR